MLRRSLRWLPHTDWGNRIYWRLSFAKRHGRWPNNISPERFTDHLYRIKTDGRLNDPLYRYCTDKEYAKDYIAGVLGPGHTPETFAVLRTDDDVDAFVPNRLPCVIKPTHASGQVLLHIDMATPLDRDLLKRWLRLDYYPAGRETNYRDLTPKVIVEALVADGSDAVPKDYKVYCFHGGPKMIHVDSDRFDDHRRNLYDPHWTRLPVAYTYPTRDEDDPEPVLLKQMLHIAARLSAPFPFARVDLYATETRILVGELTFCPEAAHGPIEPDSADIELGRLFAPTSS